MIPGVSKINLILFLLLVHISIFLYYKWITTVIINEYDTNKNDNNDCDINNHNSILSENNRLFFFTDSYLINHKP